MEKVREKEKMRESVFVKMPGSSQRLPLQE